MAAPDAKPQPTPQPAQARRGLWLAMGLALAVRGAVLGAAVVGDPSSLTEDPDAYLSIGRNVVERGMFGLMPPNLFMPPLAPPPMPTAIRTPLYPLAMAGCVAAAKVVPRANEPTALKWLIAALHLACGLATVWLTWRLAVRWEVRSPAMAALLVACDPLLLHQSTLVMTETVGALVAVSWLAAMTWLDAAARGGTRLSRALVAAGLATGLAALCRPTFLPLAGIATAALVSWAATRRTSWIAPAIYLLAVGLVLAPWMLRNQWQLGRPIVGTTHGGYTLLLGNNPLYYEHVRSQPDRPFDADDVLQPYLLRKLQLFVEHDVFLLEESSSRAGAALECVLDREANAAALEGMRQDPQGLLLATLVRWQSLWRLMPMQTNPAESTGRRTLRYLAGGWYGLEFALAGLGLYAVGSGCWRGSWRWGLLLILVFMAVHTLYWTDMRMRAPLMPVIALAAAAGWDQLRQRLARPGAIAAAVPSP